MERKKRKILLLTFAGLFVVLLIAVYFFYPRPTVVYIHNIGEAQGTTYSITYAQPDGIDLHEKIKKRLKEFDLSLSVYVPQSVISRINRNDTTVQTDADFERMFRVAEDVSKYTDGAFDITVGPLVKAWGFGPQNDKQLQVPDLKSILPHIGYKKIKLQNHRLIKSDPKIVIDANALAQGQAADMIADLLWKNGCKNYMVEIGGEIVCRGLNPKSKKWQIGIDKPIDDPSGENTELQTILSISDAAVTTSGNYRKFYYLNGKKYAHEIDPHSGYPVVHNLLSATVIAPKCIVADAYATAFMVLGIKKSLEICKKTPGLECYLIYTDQNGKYKSVYTSGFRRYINR